MLAAFDARVKLERLDPTPNLSSSPWLSTTKLESSKGSRLLNSSLYCREPYCPSLNHFSNFKRRNKVKTHKDGVANGGD